MATISKPNTFSASTTIASSEVNANFDTIYNEFNGAIAAANLASNSVTTAKIADSNVTQAKIATDAIDNTRLDTTAGQPGGAWADWTPTVSLTGGATTYAKYTQIGKTVHFRFKYTLTGALGGTPTITLPTTLNTDYTDSVDGVLAVVQLVDTGTANYTGFLRVVDDTAKTVSIRAMNAAGTYVATNASSLSATVPHTWANTDVIQISGTYEAA